MSTPVTQLEYRQPVVLDKEEVREFIRHWRDQVGAL